MTDILGVSIATFLVIYFVLGGGIFALGRTFRDCCRGPRKDKHSQLLDEEEDLKANLNDSYDDSNSDISGKTKDTNNYYGINAE